MKGKGSKISFIKAKGLYRVTCGRHYTESGTSRPTTFYLGGDEKVAEVKRNLIRAQWKKLTTEGHTVWPDEVLKRLVDEKVISPVTVSTVERGNTIQVLDKIMKDDVPSPQLAEHRAKELSVYRDTTGFVQTDYLLPYLMTIVKQEVTTERAEASIRRAIKHLVQKQPIDAVKFAFQLHQLCAEQPQGGVVVNVNSVQAADASEDRRSRLAAIVGESFAEVTVTDRDS